MTAFQLVVASDRASAFNHLGPALPFAVQGLTRYRWVDNGILASVRAQVLSLNQAGHTAFLLPEKRWEAIFFDMDSTVIREESINELARAAGQEAVVAAITEQAMAGHLDFASALRERVRMLQGLPLTAVTQVGLALTLNPGMKELSRVARAQGIKLFLVSGGFDGLAGGIARDLGFDGYHANRLGTANGALTGGLDGPLIDGEAKAQFLRDTCHRLGIAPSETLVVGDGANDLPMMRIGGAAIGYHPKPVLLPHVFGAVYHDHHALAAAISQHA